MIGILSKYLFECIVLLPMCLRSNECFFVDFVILQLATWQPLKLAIIGGGPFAFHRFSPFQILASFHHGLVRYGVAPDHPEVKASLQLDPEFKFV